MEGRKLALIIGNSEYEDGNLSRLVTPDADVNSLAETLRSPDVGGFDEVTALVNQPAATIRRAISGFFVSRGRDDLLLLYFSGHGIRDDRGQLFLAVKDTEPSLLRGTAIPASFITEEMDNSRSRRQVLILDCCHSGAFSQGMKGSPGSSVGTAAAFQGIGFGRVVLTATDSTQYAWEGDRVVGQAENSVFTQYLIQGLQSGSADTDGDGRITLDELYDYVYEQVVNVTPLQTPSKWSYGQQGDIVIAHNPSPVIRAAELPHDLQQTIDDPRPWVREGAVRELDRLMHTSTPSLALAAREALKHLADDDSRRVASSARESLAADSVTGTPPVVLPEADALPSSNPPVVERRSIEQPAAQPLMAVTGSSAAAGTVTNWPAEPAGQSELAGRKLDDTDHLTGGQLLDAALDMLSEGFKGSQRKKVMLITAAWAVGGLIVGLMGWYSQAWLTASLLGGALGGLGIGLALRQSEPAIRQKYILLIAAGWAITWLVDGEVGSWLANLMGDLTANVFYSIIGWDVSALIGKSIGHFLGSLLIGGISAVMIGLALWKAERPVSRRTMWRVILGWATAWAGCSVIYSTIYDITKFADTNLVIPSLTILTLVIGALGSRYMFRQLSQERPV